jgi:hypothetical protein
MGSLKRVVPRVAGLVSAAGAIVVSGRIVAFLGFGLIAFLALTGVFGRDDHREAAQTVLAILLGRACLVEKLAPASRPPALVGTARQANRSAKERSATRQAAMDSARAGSSARSSA